MSLPDFLAKRLRLPVICSPLFIISGPDLVIAQCKAGVVGSFPSLNARPISLLDEWLHRITEELATWDRDHPDTPSAPFAVNQIVHRSNDRLDEDMALCAKYRVPLTITSLGAREDVNREVHAWGGMVMHDIINDRFARKAIEKGADGLIAVASGAGGHAGTLSPFALVQEIRQWFEGPIALSGAIAHGRSILSAQAMGADLAYIGSLFIATGEANAAPDYKRMIVESAASDIIYSNLFTGVHGNYLGPSIVRAGLDPADLPQSDASKMNFASGGNTKAKAWKDIWGCGQGIGVVDAIEPAGSVVARLAREYAVAKISLDRRYRNDFDVQIITAGNRERTGDEIRERAARAASGFRAAGLAVNDCVALFLRNDFPFFEAALAADLMGAYAVPINWHATSDEAGFVLRDSRAKVLVVHRDLVGQIAPGIPKDILVLVVDTPDDIRAAYRVQEYLPSPATALDWETWLETQAPLGSPAETSRAAVIYTSGTTGTPKGVMRDPDPDGLTFKAAAAGYGLAGGEQIIALMNGPMYHAAPNAYGRIALAIGARIILQPRFDAEEMLLLIERHRITHMHMVPTMFVRLLRLPDEIKRRYDLSSLRFVVHGAAPCPPDIKRAMIEWWGPVIHEYYGSSETGLVTGHGSADAIARPGTVGRPLSGVDIRILGEQGQSLGAGEIGEIYVRPNAPAFTYIGKADMRAEIDRDGFVTVGDVGYLDQEGYLFLCDRKRDMIISGGVNIYPAEIEAAFYAIPGVRDCAVFGIPDEEFGEAVCAHVQPMAGAALDHTVLRESLGASLSRFKIPKIIEIVDDLPREDSGKILKRKIKEKYAVI
jgi:long-chain acyl-CoA synthetase